MEKNDISRYEATTIGREYTRTGIAFYNDFYAVADNISDDTYIVEVMKHVETLAVMEVTDTSLEGAAVEALCNYLTTIEKPKKEKKQ